MELIPGDTVQGGRLGVRNGVWSFDEICWSRRSRDLNVVHFFLEQDSGRFCQETPQCNVDKSVAGVD